MKTLLIVLVTIAVCRWAHTEVVLAVLKKHHKDTIAMYDEFLQEIQDLYKYN